MKIAVVGGGAAGMMAAASALEVNPSAQISIYDKNTKLGRKLVITGGGRCNLTTAITDINELIRNYPRGSQWLKFAMHEFGPQKTYDWFEDHGIKLKKEGLRVFPKSENGEEVVVMFQKLFKQGSVQINYSTEVRNLNALKADQIILTTGGKDGSGYRLARSAGHSITEIAPTLTSFEAKVPKLAGVTIENAKLKLLGYKFEGPFLFTHKGVSGPAVFALSAYNAFADLNNKPELLIDFVPHLSRENLSKELRKNQNQLLIKEIQKFVPKSLAIAIGINKTKKIAEVSKKEIIKIIENLKIFKIHVTGRTPGREIVTAGGVDLNQVNNQTMQSKIHPRIYFAGEILNVDGLTGGFNLQNAWATGRLAGINAAIE